MRCPYLCSSELAQLIRLWHLKSLEAFLLKCVERYDKTQGLQKNIIDLNLQCVNNNLLWRWYICVGIIYSKQNTCNNITTIIALLTGDAIYYVQHDTCMQALFIIVKATLSRVPPYFLVVADHLADVKWTPKAGQC